MSRLSPATRDSVPEQQRDIFDEIIQGSGSVPVNGPGSIMIHVPEASKRASALNQYLRQGSSLPKMIQELAMLVTAREMDCQYVWNAHAASAKAAGLDPEIVDALREERELPDLAPAEQAVINYGQEFYRIHHVSSGGFQAALEQLGKQGVVELTMLMGNYALLAFLVNAFDSGLPPNRTEAMLPV
jgi:4-carboxymuconolactone decarboxylase